MGSDQGIFSRSVKVVGLLAILGASLIVVQNVEAHKVGRTNKPATSGAADSSSCPRIKPSCCLMRFVDYEVDPGSFKDSEECPLQCCGVTSYKGGRNRNLSKTYRGRVFEYVACFAKLLFNFWRSDFELPTNCCTEFHTFKLTPYCKSGSKTPEPSQPPSSTTSKPSDPSTPPSFPPPPTPPSAPPKPQTPTSDPNKTLLVSKSTMQPESKSSRGKTEKEEMPEDD